MNDGDDEPEPADDADESATVEASDTPDEPSEEPTAVDVTPETLDKRLDAADAAIEEAETEAALDEVAADLDDIETKLEAATFPEAEDDEEAPRDRLEDRLADVREQLETARGPYGEDVVTELEAAAATLTDAEWTEDGEAEAAAAVESFLERAAAAVDADTGVDGSFPEAHSDALTAAGETVETAALDADDDAETIATLLDAAETLTAELDDAEVWDDLSVVEQLTARGFYDRLESRNRKDFPPELGVVRIAEQENDPERILMALEKLESEFMQDNCIEALRRMGPLEAYDAMMELAERRDRPAIEVLGKIGNDDACETLHEYIQDESNPPLQRVVLRALGDIGSQDSTGPVANRLVAEDAEVRSRAARALGRIGDTRAVEPLADTLADDSEDSVRAAAAWALYQIGTERALEEAAAYADDRSFIVQTEAERSRDALDTAAHAA
ncbi:HEAT repeat domain-containing protein [Halosegnis sp.]|uniref:HEAT repeat domain-containing protein n=1 Tax=Halosegnis sp. TaxID=2864959 RepID=UPI0035D48BB0